MPILRTTVNTETLENRTIQLPHGEFVHCRLAIESRSMDPTSIHMLKIDVLKENIGKVRKGAYSDCDASGYFPAYIVYDTNGKVIVEVDEADIQDSRAIQDQSLIKGIEFIEDMLTK